MAGETVAIQLGATSTGGSWPVSSLIGAACEPARGAARFKRRLQQSYRTGRQINQLIKDVQRYPFEGIGKPEPLKENLSGFWSQDRRTALLRAAGYGASIRGLLFDEPSVFRYGVFAVVGGVACFVLLLNPTRDADI